MNPKAIAVVVLLFILGYAALPSMASQNGRGHKGSISKDKMVSILKTSESSLKKDCVDGYVIDANDILEIIKTTNYTIKITNSIIKGKLDFSRLSPKPIDSLKKPLDCKDEIWKQWLVYLKKGYGAKVRIVYNKIDITDSDIGEVGCPPFSGVIAPVFFSESVSFPRDTFTGVVFFGNSVFSDAASFDKDIFSSSSNFNGTKFNGNADFSGVSFGGWADFQKTSFGGLTYFDGATFNEGLEILWTAFNEMASFEHAIFKGVVLIQYTMFENDAFFRDCTFSNEVSFHYSVFNGAAVFAAGTTFKGNAYFSNITVNEGVTFANADFQKTAYFEGSSFSEISLESVKIRDYADFCNVTINKLDFYNSILTIVESNIDFRNSYISEAHFENIVFKNDVDFSSTIFDLAIFRFIIFETNASFIRTKFNDKLSFERVNFKGETNFTEADFTCNNSRRQKQFCLSYVNFHRLFLEWNQLPNPDCWVRTFNERISSFKDKENKEEYDKYISLRPGAENPKGKKESQKYLFQPLSQVYKQLESIFKISNQLYDANEAYYFMKQAELEEDSNVSPNLQGIEKVKWLIIEKAPKKLEWIFWGLATGYGVRIWRVILGCIAVNILFTLTYFFGKPTRKYEQIGENDFTFKQRFFDFPRKYMTDESEPRTINENLKRLGNSFRLSSVILFKFGCRDTTISGSFLGINYKYIIWVEWLLGFVLLAFLVITLSNTFPLLQRLLSSVAH